MAEETTARFRGHSHIHKDIERFTLPGDQWKESHEIERGRQLRIELGSIGPVPEPIQELFDRLNRGSAWLEVTQQDDDTFSCRVITPIIQASHPISEG